MGVWASTDILFCRALYGPWNYTQSSKVGLDADYDNSWWTGDVESVLGKFRPNSLEAAANNMTYICGLYYDGIYPEFDDYVRAVNRYGVMETLTPTHVDETYWMRIIEEPAIAIANLSLYYLIWGIAWDFEMYIAEKFESTYYSFDEATMQAFTNTSGNVIPDLQASQRYSWLEDNGLLEDFMKWQEEAVFRLAKKTEEKVHAINPSLSLGILGFADSWRYWAILRAFSTLQAPVTAWTEGTYS